MPLQESVQESTEDELISNFAWENDIYRMIVADMVNLGIVEIVDSLTGKEIMFCEGLDRDLAFKAYDVLCRIGTASFRLLDET